MTYEETIHYLYTSTPVFEHVGVSAYKEGLDNTLALDRHYGHPHRQYKTIHIAGTNGKGSCSHAIASVLQEAGYKVGLYTSPHLADFRERIRVNGLCISKQRVIDFVEDFIRWNDQAPERPNTQTPKHLNDQTTERLFPSFFELTTALAFKYFAEQEVDVAVIEVGLGGRLDCTNIITPILSVITNISFDHTGLLGDTLAKIAAEKAGIIKKGVPVIIGEHTRETRPVFEAKAREMGAPVIFAQDAEELGQDIDFELKGYYQARNKQTVLAALNQLLPILSHQVPSSPTKSHQVPPSPTKSHQVPPSPTKSPIRRGLANITRNTGLMGRWQTLKATPKVVCDTGHNVAGWQYLSKQIAAQPCKTLRIVFGMVDDKDIGTVMSLLPRQAVYYWTQADNHRAIPADKVAATGRQHALQGATFPTVGDAYRAALRDAADDDFIFVGGSSYVVADLLCSLGI